MTGGGGADTFVFAAGDSGNVQSGSFDTINGFILADGTDRILLSWVTQLLLPMPLV